MALRILLLALSLSLVLAAAPRASSACKCQQRSLRSAIAAADAVFYGEITAVTAGARHHELTVTVLGVWKGTVGSTVTVRTTASSCGLVTGGAKVGRTWLFTAKDDGGVLSVRQCDGSRRATRRVRARVDAIVKGG